MFMKKGFINKMTGCSLILTLIIASSCSSGKNLRYFPEVKDGSIQSNTPFPESVIQKSDILSITVSSLNPDASAPFNSPNSGAAGSPIGYLVNTEGNIQFPLIGSINAEGLTKNQLKN